MYGGIIATVLSFFWFTSTDLIYSYHYFTLKFNPPIKLMQLIYCLNKVWKYQDVIKPHISIENDKHLTNTEYRKVEKQQH